MPSYKSVSSRGRNSENINVKSTIRRILFAGDPFRFLLPTTNEENYALKRVKILSILMSNLLLSIQFSISKILVSQMN